MPMLDMPLAELRTYQGTNPRPADFDEYWDSSLEELKNVDPAPVFKKAAFQTPNAECYDVFFTGINGAKLHATHLRPRNITEKTPVMLLFHGYRANAGPFSEKLSFVNAGYSVFALDVRGQGGQSEDLGGNLGNTSVGHIMRGLDDEDPKKMLYRDIYLDTRQLANVALSQDFADPTNVACTGVSQGGGLTIACAALEPRVTRAAVFYPFLLDYKRVWEMDLDENAYVDLRYYFRRSDPQHLREDEIFTRLGYIDLQFLAPRIKGETVFYTGLQDKICPPSTQFAAYNKLTCKKHMVVSPDWAHETPDCTQDMSFLFLTQGILPDAF